MHLINYAYSLWCEIKRARKTSWQISDKFCQLLLANDMIRFHLVELRTREFGPEYLTSYHFLRSKFFNISPINDMGPIFDMGDISYYVIGYYVIGSWWFT